MSHNLKQNIPVKYLCNECDDKLNINYCLYERESENTIREYESFFMPCRCCKPNEFEELKKIY